MVSFTDTRSLLSILVRGPHIKRRHSFAFGFGRFS